MSLHFQLSPKSKRRVMSQRLVCGLVGVLVAVGLVGGAGSLLDRIFTEPVPEYRPQFTMFVEEPYTCIIRCGPFPGSIPSRKPTAPAIDQFRPLGLAPHASPYVPEIPVGVAPGWEPDLWDTATWD
jgi:hypothetical protein